VGRATAQARTSSRGFTCNEDHHERAADDSTDGTPADVGRRHAPQGRTEFFSRLLLQVPDLGDCVAAAKRLNAVLRRKSKETLEKVLDAVAGTALASFAAGLRRDLGAVQAALELPWTTSPAEGQINRLKMLKRTMYGRAGFRLLRARVLHAT
jgi:transposase